MNPTLFMRVDYGCKTEIIKIVQPDENEQNSQNWHLTFCAFFGDPIYKLVMAFKRSQRLHDNENRPLGKRGDEKNERIVLPILTL